MKEIDFLPEWYKSGRRHQVGYRAQYAVLAGMFAVMVVWSFVAMYLVSEARGELDAARPRQQAAELVSQRFAEIQSQLAELQRKADIIARVDSRINVANVLAELSFLIDEKVVLSRVEFIAEKFVEDRGAKRSGTSVRVASGGRGGRGASGDDWNSNVRFKVVISGIAVDAAHVAELICRLEDSPYFCLVYPSFSKSSQVRGRARRSAAKGSDWGLMENYQVSEFEIGCYLANYQQQDGRLTAEPKPREGSI